MKMFASTTDGETRSGHSLHRAAARTGVLALLLMSVASCTSMRYSSAFNPSVTVEVEHPPSVGFVVDEVVFAGDARFGGGPLRGPGTPEASCEAEWVQVLTEWLVERGVRVGRLGAGRNADAMIAVNVTRCETEQERREGSKEIVERVGDETRRRTVPEHHARTRVAFRATFEVTELSTGLVAASRTLAYEPEMTNSSVREPPDFPSPGALARRAYRETIDDIAPLVFHWVDAKALVFFNDERCDLNVAHRAVEAGNYERALVISIANVQLCEPDPEADITARDVAAAHHNVGVLYRIQGDFESAMASFERARAADPGNGAVREAIRETLSAEATAADLRRDRFPGFFHRGLRPLALAVEQLTRAILEVAAKCEHPAENHSAECPHGKTLRPLIEVIGRDSTWLQEFREADSHDLKGDAPGALERRAAEMAAEAASPEASRDSVIALTLAAALATRNLVSHRSRFLRASVVMEVGGACADAIVIVWLLAREKGFV